MSTATSEAVEIEHLDWHGVECASPECQQTAAWWLICLECRHHQPFCDTHRRELAARIPRGPFDTVFCLECQTQRPASRAFEFFVFVPIGA